MPAEILSPCSDLRCSELASIPPSQIWLRVEDYPQALRALEWFWQIYRAGAPPIPFNLEPDQV